LFTPPYYYPATAVTVEAAKIWSIPIELLEKGIISNEESNRAWFKYLNKRLEKIQLMLTDEVFSDAKTRFKKFLKACAENTGIRDGEWIFIKILLTKQEVADLLSIRRETLSRILTEIKEEGNCEIESSKQLKLRQTWINQLE